ncbi:MAG: EAL domain-containing protein, partial [Caldimicrobium sp.]
AKENGIIVLAEGVETQPEAEWLAQNSVDLAQGYLFGKPSPNPLN